MGRDLEICHVLVNPFVFKQLFIFVDGRVMGVHKIGYFLGRQICMTPKLFKITTKSITGGSTFFFSINPDGL